MILFFDIKMIIDTVTDFGVLFSKLRTNAKNDINLIGFDIEYISESTHTKSFMSADWTINKSSGIIPCIIQISSENEDFIIDLQGISRHGYLPKKLIKILKSPAWIKAGVDVENDLKILSRNFEIGHCSGGWDIKYLAQYFGVKTPSLKYLSKEILGRRISKSSSLDDWSRRPLTGSMIKYAITDSKMSYLLGKYCMDSVSSMFLSIIQKQEINVRSSNLLLKNLISVGKPHITVKKNQYNFQKNYIGALNEHSQKNLMPVPVYTYKVIGEQRFKCFCDYLGKKISAKAGSKKKARRKVAREFAKRFLEL